MMLPGTPLMLVLGRVRQDRHHECNGADGSVRRSQQLASDDGKDNNNNDELKVSDG